MPEYPFMTVDVFTEERFGGNPLAVFHAAEGLSDGDMQKLAAEMNLSETSFVLPPEDPANTARVRIFNRSHEMPFAGHPNVGTAFVLWQLGLAQGETLRFEEPAGLVEVRSIRRGGLVVGAEIDAPQPLSLLGTLPADEIAACIGLPPEQVTMSNHKPTWASVGVDFVLVEVAREALAAASPDLNAFRRAAAAHLELEGRLSVFLYAQDGAGVRARMFAPLAGTWEDPATGSANATLAALRLSRSDKLTIEYQALQGVEMGRTSRLSVRAWRTPEGVRASVGGSCVPMFRGAVAL
jgi:trans-2,3-dihydro-3-hydroxyanthranilate isomerase